MADPLSLRVAVCLALVLACTAQTPACDNALLAGNKYCTHCASMVAVPVVCVGVGGQACTATLRGAAVTVPLCTSLPRSPVADGACFAAVNSVPLLWRGDTFAAARARTCASGGTMPVRLVGPTPKSGRLEVFNWRTLQWGTVCDLKFSDREAASVCRQLGFAAPYARALGGAMYGRGAGPIWFDQVFCWLNQASLADCWQASSPAWGAINRRKCTHANDVGVSCEAGPLSVRLVNAAGVPGGTVGRLEVNVAGRWGTVCTDGVSPVRHDELAMAVCRSLGLGLPARAIGDPTPVFGTATSPLTSPVWSDSIVCKNGSERSLEDCERNAWNSARRCGHTGDLTIQCAAPPIEMRLAGGDGKSGRLEIRISGAQNDWGTVCDSRFTDVAAAIVCKQLNLGLPAQVLKSGTTIFGSNPSAKILAHYFECFGQEPRLEDCRRMVYGNTLGCSHDRDVNIQCGMNAPQIKLRLVGGATKTDPQTGALTYASGRLEVLYGQKWGTVCAEGFEDEDATVACKQLGYPLPGRALGGQFGRGVDPIWLTYLGCDGTEAGLQDCPHYPWGQEFCNHADDVGIECGTVPKYATTLRLAGGTPGKSGRLEINVNGVWGTAYAPTFAGDKGATIVCKQLGLPIPGLSLAPPPGIALGGAYFGQGQGPVWMRNMDCTGAEFKPQYCYHTDFDDVASGAAGQLPHNQDVGVICGADPIQARLSGGVPGKSGRLELLLDGKWGTVCANRFDDVSATVACRMLGLPTPGYAVGSAYFKAGTGPIWLDGIGCTGNENRLQDCPHAVWAVIGQSCSHATDVGVVCGGTARPACPVPSSPTCNAGGDGAALLACDDPATSSNRYCSHCTQTPGSQPLQCIASGKPCTVNGQALPMCSTLAPPGAKAEPMSGGCFTTASGVPLAWYAQPWWMAKNVRCLANKASCECADQAPGFKLMYRVAQPVFRTPCWEGGNEEAGQLGKCEIVYFTGRRRISGCAAEMVYPWCYAEFIRDGRAFWVLDHGCYATGTTYVGGPDAPECVLNCGWPLYEDNVYCVHCTPNAPNPTLCLASGRKCSAEKNGVSTLVGPCSALTPLGAPEGADGCFKSVTQGGVAMPIKYKYEGYWLSSKASCVDRAAKCKCTGGVRGSRVLHRTALPYFDAPCKLLGTPAGTQNKCEVFTYTGVQKLSGCLQEGAEASFELCYSEFEKVVNGQVKKFYFVDHACATPDDTYMAAADSADCFLPCNHPDLFNVNKYCVHCAAAAAKPQLCIAAGKTCADRTTMSLVPMCSALPHGAADEAGCFATVTMGGAVLPVAYRGDKYDLAGTATCPDTAASARSCNCLGVPAGKRVPHRYQIDYWPRACKSQEAAVAGTFAKCQVFTATGRQRVSTCLTEAAQLQYAFCYTEVLLPSGAKAWAFDHACQSPSDSYTSVPFAGCGA